MGFVTSSGPTVMPNLADAILNLIAAGGPSGVLGGDLAHLYTNDVPINSSRVVSDFVEAVFPGYAPLALPTLAGPLNIDLNNHALNADLAWRCTGAPTTGQQCHGYYITDSGGLVVKMAERFAAPQPILAPDDFVSVDFLFPEPFTRPIQT